MTDDASSKGLGERFRLAREERGISLSDVAEQIRIRSVYLAAIEEESWSSIGAAVYIRGFIRTYARFLGLDPEEAVAAFSRTQPAGQAPVHYASRENGAGRSGPRSPWSTLAIWVTAVVAVLLVAFVVYNELTLRRAASPAPLAVTSLPSATPAQTAAAVSTTPASSAAADAGHSLALRLSAPSWLQVTVDGSVSMRGTFPAGTSRTFHGKNALVRVGNAGGVEVFVDGKDVGTLGKTGDVAERAFSL
jgi:cytoskeletal protein RodZ